MLSHMVAQEMVGNVTIQLQEWVSVTPETSGESMRNIICVRVLIYMCMDVCMCTHVCTRARIHSGIGDAWE